MAELETALYSRLTGYSGLSTLVSARVYPLILPQSPTYPAVTYQRIDGPRESALSAEMGLAHPRIQVDSWGKTYASAKAVATQVRGALQRHSDSGSDPVWLDTLLDNDEDSYESDIRVYRVRADYIIWHRE